MAKPDLDDGYKRLAHELFSALFSAGFTDRECIVLHEVFEQIYGPALMKTAELHATDMAARWGLHRQHVSTAISGLVADRILQRVENTEGHVAYRFRKDYEQWMKGGKPRFSEARLAAIRGAKKRALVQLANRTKIGSSTTADEPKLVQKGTKIGSQTEPKLVRPHIEERARQRDLRQETRSLRSRRTDAKSRSPFRHTQDVIAAIDTWDVEGANGDRE